MVLLRAMKRSFFNQIKAERALTVLVGREEDALQQEGYQTIKLL